MIQQTKLSIEPYMRSRNGPELTKATDPAFRYQVLDERREIVGYLTNKSAGGFAPRWKISRVGTDEDTGEYTTHEEAFAAFQKEFYS